jgi:hypothetical protein
VKDIYGGPIFFELDRAGDVLRFFREFIVDARSSWAGSRHFRIAPRCHSSPRIAMGNRL